MTKIVLGIFVAMISGMSNGTVNVFLKNDDRLPVCVSWPWECSWMVFIIWSIFVNSAFSYIILGDNLFSVLENADTTDLSLVIVFSVLWGFGGLCYGQAAKILGIALGSALMMSVIICVGTILPLVVPNPVGVSTSVALMAVGILFATIGFGASAKAGLVKDKEIAGLIELTVPGLEITERDAEARAKQIAYRARAAKLIPALVESNEHGQEEGEGGGVTTGTVNPTIIFILMIGAVMAAMLQFAFVFGKSLMDDAESRGISSTLSSLVIWFIAINGNSLANIAYCIYLCNKNNSWGKFREGGIECPVNVLRCLAMTFTWLIHIQCYGLAQSCLGDSGAALAWPIVMCITVLSAQAWSIFLGEWVLASPDALFYNNVSLGLLGGAVLVIAVAGYVD
jgi:L-rhamnose-H+ transport protein